MVGGCLVHNEHEMMEFFLLRKIVGGTAKLPNPSGNPEFGLFRDLADRVPWEVVL